MASLVSRGLGPPTKDKATDGRCCSDQGLSPSRRSLKWGGAITAVLPQLPLCHLDGGLRLGAKLGTHLGANNGILGISADFSESPFCDDV